VWRYGMGRVCQEYLARWLPTWKRSEGCIPWAENEFNF
jgi:hypothetical protein